MSKPDYNVLVKVLEKLTAECVAEFMVDGKWSDTGQLVKKNTLAKAVYTLNSIKDADSSCNLSK